MQEINKSFYFFSLVVSVSFVTNKKVNVPERSLYYRDLIKLVPVLLKRTNKDQIGIELKPFV